VIAILPEHIVIAVLRQLSFAQTFAQTKTIAQTSPRYCRVVGRNKNTSPVAAAFLFFLFLGISVLITGCQTAKIQNVMLSLNTVKKTVMSVLPQGMKEESLNGRELTSGYFNSRNWDEDATDMAERAYAKVLILNSGRPYKLDVNVFREKRQKDGTYKSGAVDRKLTKDLVDRLKDALADRREDRNIIDDFRAF
jgi:hypothetical protein